MIDSLHQHPPAERTPPVPTLGSALNDLEFELIVRITRQDRLKRFLRDLCASSSIATIRVVANGQQILAVGEGHDPCAQCDAMEIIEYGQKAVAEIHVTGTHDTPRAIAQTVAHWISDLLAHEYEVESLTSEVVHSYEELHLLFELSNALGGVLDLQAACNLIVQAVLEPLGAAQATLTLTSADQTTLTVQAQHPDLALVISNPAARAVATLQANAESVGMLTLEGKIAGSEFSSGDFKLLDAVAAVSASAIRNAQLYETARIQADTDALTGVANHRRLQELIDNEFERAVRYKHPLSIVMIDLDDFKLFNDTYGHPVGDRVLQTVTDCLRNNIRATDTLGRYGGDEFMLLLPETTGAGALEVAERVLSDIATREVVVDHQRLPLSLSLGIASFPSDSSSKHELIAHADSALYDSKGSGGRTVSIANAPRQDWMDMVGNTFGVLEGLVQSVDAKDHYTREHSEVVTDMALLLAKHLNLSDETIRALRIAGLLHDVGKIGIPDSVLKKPGKLTHEEREIMKQHVRLSEMIIKGVPHLNDVLDAVGHHHERYDGQGYPYGKREQEIPLLGRIMAIADAYSAMTIDRPYRKGLTWSQARDELVNGSGTQFDPSLVALFIEIVEEVYATPEPVNPPLSSSATKK